MKPKLIIPTVALLVLFAVSAVSGAVSAGNATDAIEEAVRDVKLEIGKVEMRLREARNQLLLVPISEAEQKLTAARDFVRQAEEALSEEDFSEAKRAVFQARMEAEAAYYLTFPSPVAEQRGVYVRPTERNEMQIQYILDQIEASGAKTVFLESFYHGATIWPSKVGTQRLEFMGWDPLQTYISEAHKRGLQVFAIVETFYASNGYLRGSNVAWPGPILREHPEWANLNRFGESKSTDPDHALEKNYTFLDPANPEVRAFLLELFTELITNYDLDGFYFDYTRYPSSDRLSNDFGYTDYARRAFADEYGVDPLEITPTGDPKHWAAWNKWREEKITSFVHEVGQVIRRKRPDLVTAAAVFDLEQAIKLKKQNWLDWIENGDLDVVKVMAFSREPEGVAELVRKTQEVTGDEVLASLVVYPAFWQKPAKVLVEHVAAVQKENAGGAEIFDYNHLQKGESARRYYAQALKSSVWRRPAVDPTTEPLAAAKALLRDIAWKAEEKYQAAGALTAEQVVWIKELAYKLEGQILAKTVSEALTGVDEWLASPGAEGLAGVAATRLQEDLQYLQRILRYYLARQERVAFRE